MSEPDLKVETELNISKPPAAVYEAIVNPEQMSGYFISSGSARLDAGEKVIWKWADVGAELPITPGEMEADRVVRFSWPASGIDGQVTIELVPKGDHATTVKVTETGWPLDAEGVARCLQQMQGWMNMLCCLKAYLEHGINLRA